MGRGRLSKEEIEELKQNIYVNDADEKRIFYTNEFKARFMEEYLKGKRPTRIFKDAGFNVEALGEKRIERAAARWRELYAAGGIEAFSGEAMRELKNTQRSEMEAELRNAKEQCEKSDSDIKSLNEEIDSLRKLIVNLYKENLQLKTALKAM